MRNLKMSREVKGFKANNSDRKNPYEKQGKPIVAVDFDGTLVHNQYPYCENPDMELMRFIREHKDDYVWILWTCRHGVQLSLAVEYMKREHDIEFDFINENPPWLIERYGDCRKVFADHYLDDKNATIGELIKKGVCDGHGKQE